MTHYAWTNFCVVGLAGLLLLTGCSKDEDTGDAGGDNTPTAGGGDEKGDTGGAASEPAEPIAAKDLPVPEGVKVFLTEPSTNAIMMRGSNDMKSHTEFYKSKFTEMGWTENKQEAIAEADLGYVEFTKGDLMVGVTLNPSREGDTMTITAQGNGLSVPDEELTIEEVETPEPADPEAGSLE